MEYASFDELIEDEAGPQDVPLGGGRTVQVRGLSRFEWFLAGKDTDGDANAFEVKMITMGLVTPKLSGKQVEAWRKRPGTVPDLSAVSDKIRELSGIGEGADKSSV
jgi:hypothetical protein